MGNEVAVGGRGGVMEFVDDDVVEAIPFEGLEMPLPAERLDGSEEHVGVGHFVGAVVVAQRSPGPDP